MTKQPKHHGKAWTSSDVAKLQQMASQNTPTRVIGLKLGRSESAAYSQASEQGISLKPNNQSPYNRRSKP